MSDSKFQASLHKLLTHTSGTSLKMTGGVKTQPVYHSSTLIDRSTLSEPTQSAAGPGDAIQISWILKNPSAETT